MLQQDAPDDYVLATGEAHSVREFVERASRAPDEILRGAAAASTKSACAFGQGAGADRPALSAPDRGGRAAGRPEQRGGPAGWHHRTMFHDLARDGRSGSRAGQARGLPAARVARPAMGFELAGKRCGCGPSRMVGSAIAPVGARELRDPDGDAFRARSARPGGDRALAGGRAPPTPWSPPPGSAAFSPTTASPPSSSMTT